MVKKKVNKIREIRERIQREEEQNLEENIRRRFEEETKGQNTQAKEDICSDTDEESDPHEQLVCVDQDLKRKFEGNVDIEESLTLFTKSL